MAHIVNRRNETSAFDPGVLDALRKRVADETRKAMRVELAKVVVPNAVKAAAERAMETPARGLHGGGYVATTPEDALARITKAQQPARDPGLDHQLAVHNRGEHAGGEQTLAEMVYKNTTAGCLRRPFTAGVQKRDLGTRGQPNRAGTGMTGMQPGTSPPHGSNEERQRAERAAAYDDDDWQPCPVCQGAGCTHCNMTGEVLATPLEGEADPATPPSFEGSGDGDDTLKAAHPDMIRQMQAAAAVMQTMAGMAAEQARVDDALGVTPRRRNAPGYGPTADVQAQMVTPPVPMINLAWPAGDPRQAKMPSTGGYTETA